MQRLDLMLENLAAECGYVGNLEGKVQGHDVTGSNLFRGFLYSSGRQQVDSANLELNISTCSDSNVQDSHNPRFPKPKH